MKENGSNIQSGLPLVSIITPSFNQGEFLERTILSVLNQEYKFIEYIVIDGGSTDNSRSIIERYSERISWWISEKDKGQADAINKGLEKAKGDYLCWINSDDILYPDFISRRIKEFQQNPDADLIYGDVDQGPDEENTWPRKGKQTSFQLMLNSLEIPIPQQSAIWRRRVLEKTGVLDPRWHVLLDRDYFIRIARNYRIIYIPGSLAFFRVHPASKSINESLRWAEELPVYYLSLIDKWGEYKKYSNRVMANCYWICSKIYAENNYSEKSEKMLEKAKRESLIVTGNHLFIMSLVKIKHRIFKK
jgi:glycosyltransferase involved in cell wall biosynthesis